MTLTRLLGILTDDELAAFAKYEQGRANEFQRQAARAQSDADGARKEIKRRKRAGVWHEQT